MVDELAKRFNMVVLAHHRHGRVGRRAVRFSGPPDPLRCIETVPYTVHQEYSFFSIRLLFVLFANTGHLQVRV